MQAAGAAGVVSIGGTALTIGQSDGTSTLQEMGPAVRVAHLSPDAPPVEVYLSEVEVAGAGGNGTAGNETGGGDDGTSRNETEGGGVEGAFIGEDEDPVIEDLGFREVSSYQEVEPGTYQVQVIATEDTGFIEGFLEDEERILVFDQAVEVAEETTYTAVAFGELAETELGDGTGTGDEAGSGDDGTGEDGDTGASAGDEDTADSGTGAGDDDAGTGDGAAGGDTAGAEEALVENLEFGEFEYVTVPSGDATLEIREAMETDTGAGAGDGGDTGTGDGEDTGTGDDGGTGDSAGDDTMGQAADRGFQVQILEDELTVTEDTLGGETGAGDDGMTGNETGAGDDTAGNETGTGGDTAGNETGAGDGTTGAGEEEEMARVRIFHAVPDVGSVNVIPVDGSEMGDGTGAGDDTAGNETGAGDDTAGNETGAGDDTAGNETGAGDDTAGNETGAGDDTMGNETGAGDDGMESGEEDMRKEFEVSLDPNSVYSSFATGYFNPEAAVGETGMAGDDGMTGNETGAGDDGMAGNETGAGDDTAGNETGAGDDTAGNETGAGDDTAGNETGAGDDGEDITEDIEDAEVELVTVKDAEDGQRQDGGTDDDGLIPAITLSKAVSD